LSGTGIVDPPTTTIMRGGALAPGSTANPTGTLSIAGNLAFQSGAIYLVQITPSAAASTNVLGTATLTGATVSAQFASGHYVSKKYTILTATGGLSGTTFAGITNVNLPTGASDSLSYDASNVYLNLKAGFTNFTGLNINQQSVANALTNFFNATGGIPARFFGLTPSGLTQVDGEAATGAERAAFQLTNEFLTLMLDPFVNGRGNVGGAGGGSFSAIGFAPDGQTALPPTLRSPTLRFLPRRHRQTSSSAGAPGARPSAAPTGPTAIRWSGRTPRRPAPTALPVAWTITSRHPPS
jgi:hypothetical protein